MTETTKRQDNKKMQDAESTTKRQRVSAEYDFWKFCSVAKLKNLCGNPKKSLLELNFYDLLEISSMIKSGYDVKLPLFCATRRPKHASWCVSGCGPVESLYGRCGRPALKLLLTDEVVVLTSVFAKANVPWVTCVDPTTGTVKSRPVGAILQRHPRMFAIATESVNGCYLLHRPI